MLAPAVGAGNVVVNNADLVPTLMEQIISGQGRHRTCHHTDTFLNYSCDKCYEVEVQRGFQIGRPDQDGPCRVTFKMRVKDLAWQNGKMRSEEWSRF